MLNYEGDAIYGTQSYNTAIGANMMNPTYATSSTDWGSILTNGIRGAAEGAMAGLVAEKYASGQLQLPTAYQGAQQQKSIMPLLVIGAIVYVLMKG